MTEHYRITRNRREFLRDSFGGFGMLALGSLLDKEKLHNPLAPKAPHHSAKAKSVIFLYLSGGPSQMETFEAAPQQASRREAAGIVWRGQIPVHQT